MAETTGLLNRRTPIRGTEGSNPSLSASKETGAKRREQAEVALSLLRGTPRPVHLRALARASFDAGSPSQGWASANPDLTTMSSLKCLRRISHFGKAIGLCDAGSPPQVWAQANPSFRQAPQDSTVAGVHLE